MGKTEEVNEKRFSLARLVKLAIGLQSCHSDSTFVVSDVDVDPDLTLNSKPDLVMVNDESWK